MYIIIIITCLQVRVGDVANDGFVAEASPVCRHLHDTRRVLEVKAGLAAIIHLETRSS